MVRPVNYMSHTLFTSVCSLIISNAIKSIIPVIKAFSKSSHGGFGRIAVGRAGKSMSCFSVNKVQLPFQEELGPVQSTGSPDGWLFSGKLCHAGGSLLDSTVGSLGIQKWLKPDYTLVTSQPAIFVTMAT